MENSAPGAVRKTDGGWTAPSFKRAGEALYMGSRLAFGVSTTPSKAAKASDAAASAPFCDASQKANRPSRGKGRSSKKAEDSGGSASRPYWDPDSSVASAASDRLSTASNVSNMSSESCRVTRSRAKIAKSHLQGHPKYNELMGSFPDFTQILNVKIEAGRSEKSKALAEQQGLILQLKEAVAQLTTKRDQLLEIVCSHDDVQWQQEEAFRSRLHLASDEAEERYQKILADRDNKIERMQQLESELAACQVEAALLKKKATETCSAHEALQSAENELGQREEEMKKARKKREDEMEIMQARLEAREEQTAVRNAALDGREAGLDAREQHLASRTSREDERIHAREAEIAAAEARIAERESALDRQVEKEKQKDEAGRALGPGDLQWFERQIKEIRESKARELAAMLKRHTEEQQQAETQQEEALRRVTASLNSKCAGLQIQLEEKGEKVRQLEDRLQEQTEAAAAHCSTASALSTSMLDQMRREVQEREEAHVLQQEQARQQLLSKDKALAQMLADVEELKQRCSALKEEHQERCDALKDEHQQCCSALKEEHQKRSAALQEERDAEIALKEKEVSGLRKDLQRLHQELRGKREEKLEMQDVALKDKELQQLRQEMHLQKRDFLLQKKAAKAGAPKRGFENKRMGVGGDGENT